MAWNSPTNKSIGPESLKAIPLGAPISTQPGNLGRGYKDSWDIERVYREGVKRVTWVFRCIDTISGNVARLPVIGRNDNSPIGEINDKAEVLDLLNRRSNPGEDSFAFRYRLSAQLLTSTRGAFVEILRGRGGKPIALHLLPPQYTSPIPDPKNYVAGFEVEIPGLPKQVLKPSDVLWFKHPHPLDPYLSMTPMESCGVAIEIENLAKYYNRNFLMNDGRPGGLVVVRGEMNEDDKDELRSRFRGGISRAGGVSVIASEEGVDFVDTSASPRDAAYIQMRQITKEEILAAFGVPESVTGNAAGRTFSNAAEELRVFWLETIPPHLEMLARGFDNLDDKLYFEFNTSEVPILIMAKQERIRYVMDEFQQGLATANEYREAAGRKTVDSELADSMLANPNLTPIGNTKKKLEMPQQPGVVGMPPTGMPPEGMPPEGMPPEAGGEAAALAPETTGEGAAPVETPPGTPAPEAEASAFMGNAFYYKSAEMSTKAPEPDEWDIKAEQSADRWVEILDRSLERLFERQQRVVSEKALGAKSRKALSAGTLTVDSVFDKEVWNRQLEEDIRPVLAGLLAESIELGKKELNTTNKVSNKEIQQYIDEQIQRMQKANNTTESEIAEAITSAAAFNGSDDDRHLLLKAAVAATFLHLLRKRRRNIAEHEAQSAYNAGTYLAADGDIKDSGLYVKTWVSRHDDRVRTAHRLLDGAAVKAGSAFKMQGSELRFPGDPLAPPNLTMGCRCRLKWRKI
jgi:HK97 family phage portal protein